MTIDLSNFYLMTPSKWCEYIRIHIRDIQDEIIAEYKLKEKSEANGVLYIVANCGMYGLLQSGVLANKILETRINKRGYHQNRLVPRI